jgi:hypothetical protein
MRGASRSAMPLKTVLISSMRMTDMGLGRNGRELDDDQKDRRPKYPKKRAGRSHEQMLPYGPSQRNNG